MANTYLALTIGPIYETFNQARLTRSVWAASYFFSWFIERVVKEAADTGFKILLPYYNSDTPFKSKYGSGLYADRIYFEPSHKTLEDLKSIAEKIIEEISADMKDPQQAEVYLKDYLNIHIVSCDIPKKSQVLTMLNPYLDQQELMKSFPFENDMDHLQNYLDSRISTGNLLSRSAFDNRKDLRFKSIPEIATKSLERQQKTAYDEFLNAAFKSSRKDIDLEFINEIETNERWGPLNKLLRPHHKYYAVLYADGDNISKILDKVADDFSALRKFSKKLFDFGILAEKSIYDYGGNGIYLGGEDVLAFLPMASISEDLKSTRTVFDLIQQLDQDFEHTIGTYADSIEVKKPTLSYGITISYIKYPLKEAMTQAHGLLDLIKKEKVKDEDGNETGEYVYPDKNAIGLCFQKHSGQKMECFVEKRYTKSWDQIRKIITTYTSNAHTSDDHEEGAGLLSSIIHRLRDDRFYQTLCLAYEHTSLASFFENFFNEAVHKTNEDNSIKAFLGEVQVLVQIVFDDYSQPRGYSKSRNILFTILRYIHFIQSNKE